MLVERRTSDDPTVVAFHPGRDFGSRARRKLRRWRIRADFGRYRNNLPARYELFSDDRSQYASELAGSLPSADVVNLHWVAQLMDYRAFLPVVTARLPIVWTLHDMNPFTGGCHYDLACARFTRSCGECPELGSSETDDLSSRVWRRKRGAFDQVPRERLHIVTPSRWLASEVERSALLSRFDVTVIPNGLDLDDFAPRDRRLAREALGVPEEGQAILFVSEDIANPRKGFRLLAETLKGLENHQDLILISIGRGRPALETGLRHRHLGQINEDRLLSLVYSAADVFVIPSRSDNLPNTVLEAHACGTPVIGFDAGGIGELISPGFTGLLAPAGDVDALRAAILRALEDRVLPGMRDNCRNAAIEGYGQAEQARRYADLYASLVGQAGHA